jgi:release factor glutamine methyltransferase
MKVIELLGRCAAGMPRREGLANPERETRWLLAQVLACPEAWLLAHPDADLDEDVVARLTDWSARRAAGEPAHYITGSVPFCGREFLVTPAVLIPRPETELVVEAALSLAPPTRLRVLDVGTGSGCLAVSLALELPAARVTAVDVSLAALALASRNAARLGAAVAFACGDLAAPLSLRFDLVVANLPYVPEGELAGLAPEVRDREPRVALVGGRAGDEIVRRLLASLPESLTAAGYAVLEVGPGQADALQPAVAAAGLQEVKRLTDAGGVERVLALRPRC